MGLRAGNAWGTYRNGTIGKALKGLRQDLTFGYWHFHPGVDGGQPFGVARAQSLHCLGRRARFMPASTLHYRAREGTGGGGDRGAGGPAGRGAQPSPVELASIAHVPATLSIPRIHYAPTRSSGTRLFDSREYLSSTSPTSSRLSISAIAIEARWARRACRWTCAWIMHNAAPAPP